MKIRYKVLLGILGLAGAVGFVFVIKSLLHGHTVAVLSPSGTIASQQRSLIEFAAILGLAVIVPVFSLLFFVLWRFRDGNVRAKYRPEWSGSPKLEAVWWGIPCIIIIILALVTWHVSHTLDPYRPLATNKKPMTIQVIALNWKWLFIYPEQGIATVNYVQFPKDTPITFDITSDGPMNSFWIPQLGGQIYAMAGMQTTLHLMADRTGTFYGSSANLSGKGFAGMKFNAVAMSDTDFNNWVQQSWQSPDKLTVDRFNQLAQPSENEPVKIFGGRDDTLFQATVMKYMSGHNETQGAANVR